MSHHQSIYPGRHCTLSPGSAIYLTLLLSFFSGFSEAQELTRVLGPGDAVLDVHNVYVGPLQLAHDGTLYMYSASSIVRITSSGLQEIVLRTAPFTDSVILGSSATPALDSNGSEIRLSAISAMAVGSMGEIYVAGRDSDNVVKLTPDGELEEIINSTGSGHSLDKPIALALDSEDTVYVAGAESENLLRISANGTITEVLTRSGVGNSIYIPQSQIYVDADDNVLVGSVYAFFRYSNTGELTELFNADEYPNLLAGGTLSPGHFTLDSLGNLYFSRTGDTGVFRYSTAGELQKIIDIEGDGTGERNCYESGPFGAFHCDYWGNHLGQVRAIHVDPNFNVFVATQNRAIFKIDARGHISELIDFNELGDFYVASLDSADMDNAGNFYFVSNSDHSVFRLAPLPVEQTSFPLFPPHYGVAHNKNGVTWIPNTYAIIRYTPDAENPEGLDTRNIQFRIPGGVDSTALFKSEPDSPNTEGYYERTSFLDGIAYSLRLEFEASQDFDQSAVRTIEYSKNGESEFRATGLNFPFTSYFEYEGQYLMRWLLLGNDLLSGSSNADILYGFDGDDLIYGEDGDDELIGGRGTDFFYGGNGIDTVRYDLSSDYFALSRSPTSGTIEIQPKVGSKLTYRDYAADDIEYIAFADRTIATDSVLYWGRSRIDDPPPTNLPEESPVYRFFSVRHNAFFFTSSESEKQLIIRNSSDSNRNNLYWPYVFQGAQFKPASSYPGAVDLYRFYNYRTGHHFFTASESERQFVLDKIATDGWSFTYEGTAFKVYLSDPTPGVDGLEVPVHRFYSPALNRHFFTSSNTEVEELLQSTEWGYEGIGFYAESLYE